MNWDVQFLPEALKDIKSLGGNERVIVAKAIEKVRHNPLPASDGGFGKPLGNVDGNNLTGLYKIKIVSIGVRVVYKLIRKDSQMLIIVVGARADNEVYDTASHRIQKHDL